MLTFMSRKVWVVLVLVAAVFVGVALYNTAPKMTPTDNSTEQSSPSSESPLLQYMSEADITPNSQSLNIYLFWGDGCPHCKVMAAFLESIEPTYGKYYKLYTFETWYNADNIALMERFGDALQEKITGVPALIVGDKVFVGYSERKGREIIDEIQRQYNKTERFDAYTKLEKAE